MYIIAESCTGTESRQLVMDAAHQQSFTGH